MTAVSLKSLPARWVESLVVVIGMAGVVGVMVSVLAMAQGFRTTFTSAGRGDRVVVLRQGDISGAGSAITREQLPAILNAPGLARDADGKPLATVQKLVFANLVEKNNGAESSVLLRGVGAKAFKVWPEVKIVEGRMFKPGLREVIVGRAARRQFAGLELGKKVVLDDTAWTVVGVFESDGNLHESELWGDAEVVMATYDDTGQYSSLVGVLESDQSFQAFSDAITTHPALSHTVLREPDYYARQSAQLGGLMRLLGYAVAGVMALGALFTAVNTMYVAVRSRTVEIATLRAIGFGGAPVALSVLCEALALCVAGATVGAALACLLFNGYAMSTMNWQTGMQVALAFRVSGALLAQGVAWACAIGVLGGLWPALRAARVPVVEALRTA